jgi:hypothetical protein
MTDRDIVQRVAALFGRSVLALRKRQPHHKKPYATAIKGAPAVHLMNAVRPFLGTSRQSQIDRAVASWHGRPARWARPALACSVAGCDRRGAIRGLCGRHYERWRRGGPAADIISIAPLDAPSAQFRPVEGADNDECRVAWLSGLLEGEGTFGMTRRSTPAYPLVSVEMCDEDVVARAAQILGAVTVRMREPEDEDWSTTYVARITGDQAAEWMRRVRDRMGVRRSGAIDAALAAYRPIRLTQVPTTCVVLGCGRPHRSRGLCNTHYMSWSRDRAKGRTPRITPLR